jgi:Protein of unknown function (DUF2892)
MRENVGRIDRMVRSVLGSSLFILGLYERRERPGLGIASAVAGAFLLESAITRVCPLNAAFRFDTRSPTERMRDFRADVNEQSDRIASEYAQPIELDDTTARA